MKFVTESNIIPVLKNTTAAIVPFAKANGVALHFSSDTEEFIASYNPSNIIPEFSELLCNVIVFTPQGHEVSVCLKGLTQKEYLELEILNTGANLCRISEIHSFIKTNRIEVESADCNGTLFKFQILSNRIDHDGQTGSYQIDHHGIPPYYAEIRKRLTSHFSSIESLENAAIKKSHGMVYFFKR